jgi:predicted GNAT family acetyltransferase
MWRKPLPPANAGRANHANVAGAVGLRSAAQPRTGPRLCAISRQQSPPNLQGQQPLELNRLYVEQKAIGRGYGSALMTASLEEAIARDCDTLWLGVWEHNTRAQAFYQRWGFKPVGTQTFVLRRRHSNRLGDGTPRLLNLSPPHLLTLPPTGLQPLHQRVVELEVGHRPHLSNRGLGWRVSPHTPLTDGMGHL